MHKLSARWKEIAEGYLSEDDARRTLRMHQREIARYIHAQMQEHFWEAAVDYEVVISKGFTELKPSVYTASATEPPLDYRVAPPDKSNRAKYLFGGFERCLYPLQKFQSDPERKLASQHALSYGGKPWQYLLIPHVAIAGNMTPGDSPCNSQVIEMAL